MIDTQLKLSFIPVISLLIHPNDETYNPIKTAFMEWCDLLKDAFTGRKSLRQRVLYLIKPTGWKHNVTGQVSVDLRNEWLDSKH